MPTQKINLVGGHLPTDIQYMDLFGALDYLGTRLAPLFKPSNKREMRNGVVNTLEYLIKHNFCQTFIIHLHAKSDDHREFSTTHPVPYTEQGETYPVCIDFKKKIVSCGDYFGELRIPEESLLSGIEVFIANEFRPEERALLYKATTFLNSKLSGAKKRHALINAFISEVEIMCKEKGISFDRKRMEGTKEDLKQLLQKLYRKDLGTYEFDAFDTYFDECGIKFKPGGRNGKTNFWKKLFPEQFD